MFILERLLSVIAPHICIGCEAEGSLLCRWCCTELIEPLPERCYRCHALSPDSRVCEKCRSHSPLRHVWIVTPYAGAAKQLVHKLKFERASAAAHPIARSMCEILPFLPPNIVVTHIPTATSRIRQRGYDQAALLAKAIAQEKGLAASPLLGRLGQVRQVGASRKKRHEQLNTAFYSLKAKTILNQDILLVDDIVTTGSSIEAAARVLKQSGAKSVSAIVFAQKQ